MGRGERSSVVDRDCQVAQEAVVEVAGNISLLSEAEQRHLDSCNSCRALADVEHRLGGLLETAVPPSDPAVEAWVMRALQQRSRHHGLVTALPVAASLLIAVVGVSAVGGVPGGSLLALLPLWSSQGWLTLAGAATDWVVAIGAASRAAQFALPPLVHLGSVIIAIAGAAAMAATTRRWRTLSQWRTHA
jgi:predicted anti-sigma-YlaC factor YlaD